jgi:hypothetical protein
MRKLILILSATAMAVAMPAMAKPGQGGGKGGAKAHAGSAARVGPVKAHGNVRTRTDAGSRRASSDARARAGARVDRTRDTDGDGIPDYRDRRIDRDRDGIDDRAQNRYGANACPPGLAAKNNNCMPPGQARKMFAEGQRLPTGYNFYTPYQNIPGEYQRQYGLDPNGRYIYRDGRIYDVDPTTLVVRRIIEGLSPR